MLERKKLRWSDDVIIEVLKEDDTRQFRRAHHALWIEEHRVIKIRLYRILNFTISDADFRKKILALLRMWQVLFPEEIIRPKDYRILGRDLVVIYEWPDSTPLSFILEKPGLVPFSFVCSILAQIFDMIHRWHTLEHISCLYHGCLTPDTIFLLPGGKIRLSPPVGIPENEEIYSILWPIRAHPERSPKLARTAPVPEKHDIFSIGSLFYTLMGFSPWYRVDDGTPIPGLLEPFQHIYPWLPSTWYEFITLCVHHPDKETFELMYQNWKTLVPFVDHIGLLEIESECARERLRHFQIGRERLQRAVEENDTLQALYWYGVLKKFFAEEWDEREFGPVLSVLKSQIPYVHTESKNHLPPIHDARPLTHQPSLLFPYWTSAMEKAFQKGEMYEAFGYYLRLKLNRAPLFGEVAYQLSQLEGRLRGPRISLAHVETRKETAQKQPAQTKWRFLKRAGLILVLPVLIILGILKITNGNPPIVPDYPPPERPVYRVCESGDRLPELKRVLTRSIEKENWIEACDVAIQILGCLPQQDPLFDHYRTLAHEVCGKVTNQTTSTTLHQ